MKFGHIIKFPSSSIKSLFEESKKAEKSGFNTIFYADHTVDFLPGSGKVFDAFNTLSALAMITKLQLGTAVSDCHRFHPALMAHKVATLDHISSGRAMVGIGAGEKINIDMYGLNRDKILSKLREYIELMRKFWAKKKVSKQSEFWGHMNKAYIQLKPFQKAPPIYIAANSPKTRQLTGELGDGWFPVVESHWTYKDHKKEIVECAIREGRNPDEIDYALQTVIAIDDKNPENAVKVCEPLKPVILVTFPNKLNQLYPSLNLPTDLSVFNYDWNSDVHNMLPYLDKLPESILSDTTCVGTTEDVIRIIEKFKQAGVTQLALFNYGPDTNNVFEIMRDKIVPYFKSEDN